MSAIQTYKVSGMHCASCAGIIERTLEGLPGVASAEVNYATESAKITFDRTGTDPRGLSLAIEPLGYSLAMPPGPRGMSENESAAGLDPKASKKEKLAEIAGMRAKVSSIMPLAAFSALVMAWDILAEFKAVAPPADILKGFFHHLLPIFATYALVVVGRPYLLGIYRFLRYGKANMDTLVGIGTSAAFLYSFVLSAFEGPLARFVNVEQTYYDVTIVVIAFITLGKYLEARAKLKTGDAIEKLLNLQTKTALVLRDGEEREIAVDQVAGGDLVLVKPGQSVPVDGTVTDGSSFVDESMVTGEPMPTEKSAGDTVIGGTMNTSGAFTFKATSVGPETLLAKIIRMVEEAQGSRAPIQTLADKISSAFVPIVLALSFVALAAWLAFGIPSLGFPKALSYALSSFVGILVIACPCALGLATPTAIIVGVGKGAKEGILIKDAATLEKLHTVDTVVVDKTGTITNGKPELVGIEKSSRNLSDDEVVSILASLESKSEHPIAHAVMAYAKKKMIGSQPVLRFAGVKGEGVRGSVGKTEYFAGNVRFMAGMGLSPNTDTIERETAKGKTPVILATKDEVVATAFVADAVKPEAAQAVRDLQALGIKIVMLTGDMANTAQAVARQVGIDAVIAEVLPDGKLDKIKQLQAQGRVVAMAGDGVNDAPALARADVGIAMGTGTDIAIDAAGITLLHGDLSKLVKAVRLSKITMAGIRQNLFWAFVYNIVGIPLAGGLFFPLFGWLLNPVFAGLAMAFSSASVVGNSLRLKAKSI